MKTIWVICEPMEEDCGHRWIAFPATEDNLTDVIEIAKIGGDKIFIAEQIKKED